MVVTPVWPHGEALFHFFSIFFSIGYLAGVATRAYGGRHARVEFAPPLYAASGSAPRRICRRATTWRAMDRRAGQQPRQQQSIRPIARKHTNSPHSHKRHSDNCACRLSSLTPCTMSAAVAAEGPPHRHHCRRSAALCRSSLSARQQPLCGPSSSA